MRRRLLPGRALQHRANFGCSCRVEASSPGTATTSGSPCSAARSVACSSRSRSSASASCSSTAVGGDQIDRLTAVGIDEIRIGSSPFEIDQFLNPLPDFRVPHRRPFQLFHDARF